MSKKPGRTHRRKLAIATWSAPKEGNVYGRMMFDVSEALKYIDHVRKETEEKVTITHLVGKAVGKALAAAPGLNGRILFDRYYAFSTVDLAFLVSLEDGGDLGKVKVCDVDKKSITAIARELREYADKLRAGKDEQYEKSKGVLKILPTFIIRPLIWFTGFLSGSLGVSMKFLGVERFPFGSCIITSVGMFGVDEAFAPPTPFARVPLYVVVGAIRDMPTAVDGKVEIRPQITITITVDHRFVDGHEGARLLKIFRSVLEDPWQLERDEAERASSEGASSEEKPESSKEEKPKEE